MTCEYCHNNPAKHLNCNGDGRLHWHGGIHMHPTLGGHLYRVCEDCHALDAKAWKSTRPQR